MEAAQAKIELWDVDHVLPYPKNFKKHPADQVSKIAAWIMKTGWTQPIVIQKSSGFIIAGHGRRLAAIEIGLKKVPVIVKDVDDQTANAMRIADNQVVSTDYDTDMMRDEIVNLKDLGFEIDLLGFDEKDLLFLNEEMVVFDNDAFVDDITSAVEAQKAGNAKSQAETDERDNPLSKSFGFKRLTVAQGRKVRSFMSHVELETGKNGVDGLMIYIDGLLK